MKAIHSALLAGSLLLLPQAVCSGEHRGSDLRKRADAIRPTVEELRFELIPWVTDVFEGFRLAKAEGRPVFLYVVTGDPLEDC